MSLGSTEYAATESLIDYSRVGALEGSLRGSQPRSFSDIYNFYNSGGTVNRQELLLTFDEKTVTAAIADPSILKIDSPDSKASVIKQNGNIRQVLTDTGLTDVEALTSGGGYTVRFWALSSIPAVTKVGGLYGIPQETPAFAYTFKNPDYPADLNRIDRTTVENTGGAAHTVTERFEETFVPGTDPKIPATLTITRYAGAGVTGAVVREEKLTYSNRGTGSPSGAAAPGVRRYWDYDLEREISEASVDAAGTLGALVTISHTYEKFADFSVFEGGTGPDLGGKPGARRMISITQGYDTQEAVETVYTYINEPTNKAVHGRLQSVVNPDGSWEYYEYVNSPSSSTAIETKYSSWKNVTIADRQNARKTVTVIEAQKTTSETTIAGQLIAKSEMIISPLPDGRPSPPSASGLEVKNGAPPSPHATREAAIP